MQPTSTRKDILKWMAGIGSVDKRATKLKGALPAWARQLFLNSARRAQSRGVAWMLTQGEFAEVVKRANGYCEVSGIALTLNIGEKKGPYGPSIDRIDSSLGYTKNNIRLVCIAMNYAMNEWGFEAFLPIAISISQKHSGVSHIPNLESLEYE